MSWTHDFIGVFEQPNINSLGVQGGIVGKVIGIDPLRISISDGTIVLDELVNQLYICNQLLDTYRREFNGEGYVDLVDKDVGMTYPAETDSHIHNIEVLDIEDAPFKFNGDITFIDTLKLNDHVMLVPDMSGQAFFIVDKVKDLRSG